ncbi:hypothetical protein [aff. Roholtiella sp. LEGE 12411]|uniref:hypothetical protein n=1 Tax=aff. Roholtiella sp. LEGE 12411 TaxID=1828822 RepID=UPI0018824F9E|nr:hypothetical protein [aff. Roholtiella sp. LEGE 12411]MBE9037189.1 hypothetical protein [aff. Roholtiella sp. LEGE 12411]
MNKFDDKLITTLLLYAHCSMSDLVVISVTLFHPTVTQATLNRFAQIGGICHCHKSTR